MKRLLIPALALLFVASACTTVNVNPAGPEAASQADTTKPAPFKPWDEVLKDTRAYEGFFKMHLRRDQTLYLEVPPERLEKDFGLVLHISRGVGDFDVHDGLPLSPMMLVRLRRVGDQLYLVHRNARFTAEAGSPMRVSLEDNTGHSIIAAARIESQHEATKNVLVDLTGFFVSDYADVATWLKYAFDRKPVGFEKEKSYVEQIMAFPRNVEVDVLLTYKPAEYPSAGAEAVPDYRSIPVGVRYSLVALPEQPMRPRLADDRVGHFLDAVKDFSRDQEIDPYVRYVNRWRLEKKDPSAALSEPLQPIVFYIDRSVPKEYRRYVKEGIEAWNKAFEQAGFKQAIVAKEAPEDDSTWSAEDTRYSTVRWTAAHRMGYAIGPSQTDPRTGEILNADILISSNFVRGFLAEYQELAGPEGAFQRLLEGQQLSQVLPRPLKERLCLAQLGGTHQLGVQYALLVGLGVLEAGRPMPETYLGDAIRDLVMHEVGHTLGLRHNFRSSSGVPYEQLHDTTFTRKNGISLSVMDYAAVNVSLDLGKQGHYWNKEVGSYDVWAIRYAYTPVHAQVSDGSSGTDGKHAETPEAEREGLRKIAEQGADPLHTYGTDEDNWLGPYAVDPLTSAWDLGSDPLRHARDRGELVRRVQPRLEQRIIGEGEGYQRLRRAATALMIERLASLLPVTKTVGGLYFARDHRGDPNERTTFIPVPASRQREAVSLIVNEAFAEDAFPYTAEFLNKLAPNRYGDWASGYISIPVDYPVHEYVALVQRILLEELLHPARLARMIDNGVRMPDGSEAYTPGELFQALTTALWSELGASGTSQSISSFRRNLQLLYVSQLGRLLLGAPAWQMDTPAGPVPVEVPEQARALARLELMDLSSRIGQAFASGGALERATRAHLTEARARMEKALEASLTIPVNGR